MRTRSILAAVLAALLFVAACGGDSGDPESLSSEQSQDDSNDGDSDSGGSDSGDSDGDIGDLGDLPDQLPDAFGGDCVEFALAYSTVFLGGFAAAFGGEGDIAELEAEMDDLGGSVPSEIADEFNTVTEAYSEYFEGIGDEGLLGAVDVPAPEEDPDVAEAQEVIDDWLADNCAEFE